METRKVSFLCLIALLGCTAAFPSEAKKDEVKEKEPQNEAIEGTTVEYESQTAAAEADAPLGVRLQQGYYGGKPQGGSYPPQNQGGYPSQGSHQQGGKPGGVYPQGGGHNQGQGSYPGNQKPGGAHNQGYPSNQGGQHNQGYPQGGDQGHYPANQKPGQGYPQGQGGHNQGYPQGQGGHNQGYPQGSGNQKPGGVHNQGYPQGQGGHNQGYPQGQGGHNQGYPQGQGGHNQGYPQGPGNQKPGGVHNQGYPQGQGGHNQGQRPTGSYGSNAHGGYGDNLAFENGHEHGFLGNRIKEEETTSAKIPIPDADKPTASTAAPAKSSTTVATKIEDKIKFQ